nr:siphovirus Gp157 family protein [Bacteriovorax sp. HI3]
MSDTNSVETKKEMTLYGAAHELASIEAFMNEENFVALGEGEQQAVADKMQEMLFFLNSKTDAVCGFNSKAEDFINAIDNRIAELKELKEKCVKKQANFHKYILAGMDQLNTNKLVGNLYSISYRKPLLSVEILNENELPTKFIKTKEVHDIDKAGIKKAIEEGQVVNGAHLKLGERKLSFKAGK